MSNLSVLAENTCYGLNEEAAKLYLRGHQRDELRAFKMACKWQDVFEPLLPKIIAKSVEIIREQRGPLENPTTEQELLAFMRERHFRKYFPDGRE